MKMTELYEFAKQFDVIVVFVVLYGMGISGIVYVVTDFFRWCFKKLKQHRGKRHTAESQSEE